MSKAVQKAIVVGAGTMGTSLARLMAVEGISVTVVDTSDARLAECRDQLKKGPAGASEIRFTSEWQRDITIDAVIESVTEDIAVKQKVVALIEAHVGKNTLIMTNTSGLPIDDIARDMQHPERLIGAHFFNPADVIPAVEVVPGSHTKPEVVTQVRELLLRLGKRPAVLSKAVPGFVANRIQHAIMRECLALLESGVVEAEALDDIIRYAIGVRMALNGPLRQRDINGLDTHLNISRYLYADLNARKTPSPLLESYVAQGRLGAKSGEGFYRWDNQEIESRADRERELLEQVIALANQV